MKLITSSMSASLVDVATLLLLVHFTALAAGPAAVLACLAGGAVNFLLSRQWVFGARSQSTLRQVALYLVLVVCGGALLGGAVVQAAVVLGASLLVAKALAAALVFACWNYPISSRLVFAKEPSR